MIEKSVSVGFEMFNAERMGRFMVLKRLKAVNLGTKIWKKIKLSLYNFNDKKCVKKKKRGRHLPGYWQ